jgi:hypothetical protein
MKACVFEGFILKFLFYKSSGTLRIFLQAGNKKIGPGKNPGPVQFFNELLGKSRFRY